jgi:RNA polymerase sigma-70 factor (ECF subfamily)
MTAPRTCAECGSELPSDAKQGLCPKCLLQHGKDLFEQLKPMLTGGEPAEGYAQVVRQFGMSETAVKTAAFRLRKRYGHLLREQIAQTVADPTEIEEEIRDLFSALQ